MGSKNRETRMRQMTEAESAVAACVAKLKAAGLNEKAMTKDPGLRSAKALVKKTTFRIKAIEAKEALIQSLIERKAQAKGKVKGKPKKGAKAAKDQGKPKKVKAPKSK